MPAFRCSYADLTELSAQAGMALTQGDRSRVAVGISRVGGDGLIVKFVAATLAEQSRTGGDESVTNAPAPPLYPITRNAGMDRKSTLLRQANLLFFRIGGDGPSDWTTAVAQFPFSR